MAWTVRPHHGSLHKRPPLACFKQQKCLLINFSISVQEEIPALVTTLHHQLVHTTPKTLSSTTIPSKMAPVQLDTRPLAIPHEQAQACSALQDLKLGGRLNPILISSSPVLSTNSSDPPALWYCPLCESAVEPNSICLECKKTQVCHECNEDMVNGSCHNCDTSDLCPNKDCRETMYGGVCLLCEEHSCQNGNFDCYPCQLALAQVYDERHEKKLPQDPFVYKDGGLGSLIESDDENRAPDSSPERLFTDVTSPTARAKIHKQFKDAGYDLDPDTLKPVLRERIPETPAPEDLPSSPTDDQILDLLIPTPSPSSSPSLPSPSDLMGQSWMRAGEQSPTRRLWMQPTTLSPSPPTFGSTNSVASLCQESGWVRVNHVGSVATSCSLSLNLALSGHMTTLLHLSNCLVESTSSDENAMWMADIISIVSLTSRGNLSLKIHTSSVSVHVAPGHQPNERLLRAYSALAKLMRTYYESRELPTMPSTTSRNMETSSRATSRDQLCGALTQLATITSKEAWRWQLKQSFLRTLKDILHETTSYLAGRFTPALTVYTGKTNFPRLSRTTSFSGSPSTGTGTPLSENGSGITSPIQSPSLKRHRGREPTQTNSERSTKRRSS